MSGILKPRSFPYIRAINRNEDTMETPKRTLLKTLTWQALGLVMMTLIGFMMTGSVGVGGSIALSSAAVGAVCYMLHERAWARIAWGRLPLHLPQDRHPDAG